MNKPELDLEEAYRRHLRNRPIRPQMRKIILVDTTPSALKSALAGNGQSIGIISDEAGMFFGGYLVRELALLNSLWSGKREHPVDRAKEEDSYVVSQARATIVLQVQPPVFDEFMSKRSNTAIGSGWMARYLVTFPISTQGYRFGNVGHLAQCSLDPLHERMTELLCQKVEFDENGDIQRRIIQFDQATYFRWQQIVNDIEARLMPFHEFSGIREIATRLPDQISRLAALFSFFSKAESISLDALERAGAIVQWYSTEALRLFNRNQIIEPEYITHARLLHNELINYFNVNGQKTITLTDVYELAPNAIKKKIKIRAALKYLESMGRIITSQIAGKKTVYVDRAAYFYSPIQGQG